MVRDRIQCSVALETKLCSLTTANPAAGCQPRNQMRRMFFTDHYLTAGSQCEDMKQRQYLHNRTEVLIKNWCDANRTDSKRMGFVGYSSM